MEYEDFSNPKTEDFIRRYHEEISACRKLVFPGTDEPGQGMLTKQELEGLLRRAYYITFYSPGWLVGRMYQQLLNVLNGLYAWECYHESLEEAEEDATSNPKQG